MNATQYLNKVLEEIKASHNYSTEMEIIASSLAKDYHEAGVTVDEFVSILVNEEYEVVTFYDLHEVIGEDNFTKLIAEVSTHQGSFMEVADELSDSELKELFSLAVEELQNIRSVLHSEFDGLKSFVIIEQ